MLLSSFPTQAVVVGDKADSIFSRKNLQRFDCAKPLNAGWRSVAEGESRAPGPELGSKASLCLQAEELGGSLIASFEKD
jgi:hypothetical protein